MELLNSLFSSVRATASKVLVAAGLGAAVLGAAPADAGTRIDVDIRFGGNTDREERVWIDPVYQTVTDRVWVEPVYQTVTERVWIEPTYRTVCERVWIEPRFELRPVIRWEGGRRCDVMVKVCIEEGRWETRSRQVLECAGRWEYVSRRVCVSEGHWRTVERRVCVREGYWETRRPAVMHPYPRHDFDRREVDRRDSDRRDYERRDSDRRDDVRYDRGNQRLANYEDRGDRYR